MSSKEYIHALVVDKKTGQLIKQPMKFNSSNCKIERNMKNHIETEIRRNKRFEGK